MGFFKGRVLKEERVGGYYLFFLVLILGVGVGLRWGGLGEVNGDGIIDVVDFEIVKADLLLAVFFAELIF